MTSKLVQPGLLLDVRHDKWQQIKPHSTSGMGSHTCSRELRTQVGTAENLQRAESSFERSWEGRSRERN